MKKIALLYAGKSNQGGITSFYKDILGSFDSNEYSFDLYTVTEAMPLDVFSNVVKVNTPKWLLNLIFKFNLHIPYSSLVMTFFYNKLKKYDKVIINQELAFPLGLLLKNDVTILHGSTLMAMHSWYKEKKWFYTLYYFIVSFNTILTYLVASKIYTVSDFTKTYITRFNKNVEVCGLGVDQNFWKYNPNVKKSDFGFGDNDFLLIFVGRFDIGKGSDKIIDIMKNNTNNDIKLLACVSNVPVNYQEYEKYGIKFYKNLGKSDLLNLYSISDTFLFPTRYEGYGLVLAEALSVGLPAITTNIALGNLLKDLSKNNSIISNRVKVFESNDNYNKFLGAIYEYYLSFKNGTLTKKRLDLDCLYLEKSTKSWKEII